MLLIWSGAKADILKEALDGPFSRVDHMPDHKVIPLEEDQLLAADEGDVVLAMGVKSLKLLQAHGIAQKNRTLEGLRLKPLYHPNGGAYLFTLDPFMVRTRADAPSLIGQDAAMAVRLATTGSIYPQMGDYRYVENFDEMCHAIYRRIQQGEYVEVAGDLETLGLYPEAEGARIITAQFSIEPGKSDVYYFPPDGQPSEVVARQIRWMHSHPQILMTGANYKFDLRWMRRHLDVDCTNLKRDTLIMGSMVNENRSNSLKSHAWEYTSLGGYDSLEDDGHDKGRMDLIPKEVLLPYAGGDTDVTLQSAPKIKKELEQEGGAARLYRKVVLPASRGFELMEHEGVVVDVEKMQKLQHELTEEIESLTQQMLEMMPSRLKAKYSDNLSITRPSLLRDFFFSSYGLNLKPRMVTEKSGEPSTAKAHLMMFHDNEDAAPFIDLLDRHGSASKTLSTFVVGFMKHLRADGRFHPSYMLFAGSLYGGDSDDSGTTTGRTSCKDPAFQCCVGGTLVHTDQGLVRIDKIVAEGGAGYKVLTHTGAWRRVIGTYRNGKRPVFKVRTLSGKEIVCTANHPLLTDRGFLRTDCLTVGMNVFTTGSYDENPWTRCAWQKAHPDLSVVGGYEDAMPQSELKGLAILRRARNNCLPGLDDVRGVFGRHGGVSARYDAGAERPERQLCTGELLLASEGEAERQQAQLPFVDLQWRDTPRRGVGSHHGPWGQVAAQAQERLVRAGGSDDALAAHEAAFVLETIVSIEDAGVEETFDLTIDRCHSFVADDLVVHNTVPKKTAWAKRLRDCYPAPPGYVILQLDFSQGELKVVACVADEGNMIAAFRSGLDLHCVTAASFMDMTYEQFRALEETDPFTYNLMRTGAKAGNFGLLYGMQAPGFREYARINYKFSMTMEEAEARRHLFLNELYPGLTTYHQEAEAFIKKYGYIESPLGRRRHLPLAKSPDRKSVSDAVRQGINAPIQSTLNDLAFMALPRMQEALPQLRFFGMIHDALYAYVPIDNHVELSLQARDIMSNLPIEKELGWSHALQFNADAEVGPVLSKLEKIG